MAKRPTKTRVTVSLYRWQIVKLEKLARKFWPPLNPRKCRASALGCLLHNADVRSASYYPFRKPLRPAKTTR